MTVLPHLAARLFGVPLAIHRPKLDVILSVLGSRIGIADLAAPVGSKPVARWVLWLRYGNQWYVEIHRNSRLLVNMDRLTAIAAAAVDHVGNESPRSAWVVN